MVLLYNNMVLELLESHILLGKRTKEFMHAILIFRWYKTSLEKWSGRLRDNAYVW